MVVAISFCIYGSNIKYCKGMVENLELIKKNMPDVLAFIYVGIGVPENYIKIYESYSFARLFYTNKPGAYNMVARFFAIDEENVDIMIVRDADSRVHNRDRWIIKNFINSTYDSHTIRDHPWHTTQIMGGLFGIKKSGFPYNMSELYREYNPNEDVSNISYQYDQTFLRNIIYPLIKDKMIVYAFSSTMNMFQDKNLMVIPFPVKDHNFCGAVIEYDASGNGHKPFLWNVVWNYLDKLRQ